jgi:transcriptional regulator with XRE-family HTH domain
MRHDTSNKKTVGKNLKRLRMLAGLSQQELAQKIGVTQPRIARWEKGEVMPYAQYLAKLAKALEVTIDEIIRGN